MGTWAFKPWDSDEAADWYGTFMNRTRLRAAWLDGIRADPTDEDSTVRAAAAVFIMLGRVYVWPVEHYEEDLQTTIAALSQVLATYEEYDEPPELIAYVKAELAELEARRTPTSENDGKKDWWRLG